MHRIWLVALALGLCTAAGAQDLVIVNAHILDGNGGAIEQGSVVVQNGRIESVRAGNASVPGALRIDARGRTVMPGLIDAHRHLIDGDPDTWLAESSVKQMQEYLDAGFTSVLASGDPTSAILELRRRLGAGELAGPRLLVSGEIVSTSISPAEARGKVRELQGAGVDVIKTVYNSSPDGSSQRTLEAIVDESNRLGIETMVHAITATSTVEAVETGPDRLVHTPHTGVLSPEAAAFVAGAGIPMTSTLGVFVPLFADDGSLLWRDRSPLPEGGVQAAGQGPVNGRFLWDEGIVYGFGTDTRFLPRDSLMHELKALQILWSPRDIVSILTKNAAAYMRIEDEVGTLARGKVADLVMLEASPLEDVHNYAHVVLVVQGGSIVSDQR